MSVGDASMAKRVHFIAGLPRSGSTLLSALLRQNPLFSASVTSPVFMLCNTLLEKMGGSGEFTSFFNEDRRQTILRGVIDSYYTHISPEQVTFDTNRLWTSRTALLKTLYPDARIICCVRNVGWVIDSLERMLRANPLQLSRMFNFKLTGSVYERAEILMNSETGLVGLPWSTFREAWFGDQKQQLLVVDYDRLIADPRTVLESLYNELGYPTFTHDFENVEYDEPVYDSVLGMPGMHTVRQKVGPSRRNVCIPPDIFSRYSEASFWLRPESNVKMVKVL